MKVAIRRNDLHDWFFFKRYGKFGFGCPLFGIWFYRKSMIPLYRRIKELIP